MVLAKILPFFQLFILGNIGKKNVFYEILQRLNGFLTYKNKFQKSKRGPKGLVHGFGQNLAIFPTFYFREYRPKKCVLR